VGRTQPDVPPSNPPLTGMPPRPSPYALARAVDRLTAAIERHGTAGRLRRTVDAPMLDAAFAAFMTFRPDPGAQASDRTRGALAAALEAALASAAGPVPAGALTTEDVRRAYYAAPSTPRSSWIDAVLVDPLQLLVYDEETGRVHRVPVLLDGDTVRFGRPEARPW
jgi:hypothetical protein